MLALGKRATEDAGGVRCLLAIFLVACGATTITDDFGVVPPGCRAPSACYITNCSCTFSGISDCVKCDPKTATNNSCPCSGDAGTQCLEPAQLCQGRGASCSGHCVRAGGRCSDEGEAPERLTVSSGDAAPTTELRCAYSDDVCCPDADAGVDLAMPSVDASHD